MKMTFLCSPYRGDVEKNIELAKRTAYIISRCGKVPVAPHLIFPQFLDDSKEAERLLGIQMGLELMKNCSEMWVVCNEVTEGMQLEIKRAMELGIDIRFYDSNLEGINHDTISIDKRLGPGLKQIIADVDSNRRTDKRFTCYGSFGEGAAESCKSASKGNKSFWRRNFSTEG
jgi:hypothetical protein